MSDHKNNSLREVSQSPEFKKLVKNRWIVSLSMTALILFIYLGYLLIIGNKKEVLATEISQGLTLGLPIGIAIIFFAWLMTGVYVIWANKKYDKTVQELKNKLNK